MSRCQAGDLLVLGAPLIVRHLAGRPEGPRPRWTQFSARVSRTDPAPSRATAAATPDPRTGGAGGWRKAGDRGDGSPPSPFIGDRQRVSLTVSAAARQAPGLSHLC